MSGYRLNSREKANVLQLMKEDERMRKIRKKVNEEYGGVIGDLKRLHKKDKNNT